LLDKEIFLTIFATLRGKVIVFRYTIKINSFYLITFKPGVDNIV